MAKPSPLLAIFLIVLVDVFGFAIAIPLLPLYVERFGAGPLMVTLIISSYALCSLISTPLIGSLSDRYGRKRLLLASQAGSCAGFLMLGFAGSLWMVFASRIIDGVTAGNLATAEAYISDHTKPEHRAKAFGMIGAAFGVGLVFGPWLGGELGVYGVRMIGDLPFLLSAGLSALSMLCTAVLLTNERPPHAADVAGPSGRRSSALNIATYVEYFRRPLVASLFGRYFLFTFSFSAFLGGFVLFVEQRLGWTTRETGYMLAYIGLVGVVLQGGLVGKLVARFGETRLALAGFLAAAIGYALLGFAHTIAVLVIASTINGFGSGVLRPVLTSQISQAVASHEQGIALGICGSLSALAMTLAPPTGGVLLDRHWPLAWTLVPTIVASLGLVSALVSRRRAT